MRIFDHPNSSTPWQCPICQKDTDARIVLMPIPETEDGNVMEAHQVHVACLRLWLLHVAGELI